MERQFGVPREIVIAIWGLETNVRRRHQRQIFHLPPRSRRWPTTAAARHSSLASSPVAFRINDEAHMRPEELRGGWAGEIGQTQFLPTPYVKYAVDFDGDGKKDPDPP